MQVITTSSKSLRDQRKKIVAAALLREGQQAATITPEEGVDQLIRTEKGAKVLSWYRNKIAEHSGSIPSIAGEFFTKEERDQLNAIESQLWERTDKATPPKTGGEVGTRMALRLVMQNLLIPLANQTSFPPSREDSAACFVESVNAGLPKLRTPKGAVASADAESLIRMLLGF